MKVIGITGGVGMGKSVCGQMLRDRGVPVIDTDTLARELVLPGQAALNEIVAAFGPGMIDSSGNLRRGELARRVFPSEPDRRRLEGILHPRIRARWVAEVQRWTAEGKRVGAVIIPLLFETEAQREMDVCLCVACSETTQRLRLSDRGWSPDHIKHRIDAQMAISRKMELSDYVIWSEGTLQIHAAQLDRILSRLTR